MRHLPSNTVGKIRAAWRAAEGITARTTPCFRVVNATGRPKLYVYDVIGGWDLDAGEFVRAVHEMEADEIDLHINSPGGLVYDAVAMFEALAAHDAKIFAHVDGLAASAASFLLMAAEDREIAKGGRTMIHDAQVLAWGSPADLREAADLGDAISNDIAGYYADRAGGEVAAWRAAMTATTWYSAQESVDAGLVDRVAKAKSKSDEGAAEDRASQLIRARARVTLGGVKR